MLSRLRILTDREPCPGRGPRPPRQSRLTERRALPHPSYTAPHGAQLNLPQPLRRGRYHHHHHHHHRAPCPGRSPSAAASLLTAPQRHHQRHRGRLGSFLHPRRLILGAGRRRAAANGRPARRARPATADGRAVAAARPSPPLLSFLLPEAAVPPPEWLGGCRRRGSEGPRQAKLTGSAPLWCALLLALPSGEART